MPLISIAGFVDDVIVTLPTDFNITIVPLALGLVNVRDAVPVKDIEE